VVSPYARRRAVKMSVEEGGWGKRGPVGRWDSQGQATIGEADRAWRAGACDSGAPAGPRT
jgi:hypothetical protein